jgi:HSP20 family molecular chaperone IbpA
MTSTLSNIKKDNKPSYFRQNGLKRKRQITPAANIDETSEEYTITIATPGFTKEKLSVQIKHKEVLVYSTALQKENSCVHDLCEYDLSKWKRTFMLPADADALMARARCVNGELIIHIPKGTKYEMAFDHPVVIY